jgi:hypothetical protein
MGKTAQIIESHNMVGVRVSENYGIKITDVFA